MKKLAIAFFASISLGAFSQMPDHTITLKQDEQFVKLPRKQVVDSLNMNQVGPEQFEFIEIYLTQEEAKTVDSFMKNCKSIQPIIDKYGGAEFDLTVGSNSNKIRPISGFYYSVENVKRVNDHRLTLTIIYPRTDRM
ncbi:hypothetical protein UFOVP699_134 [uncultured Caudovirales phage]|uniref:Uncharacterized protein n=1 Tax=uncultured Caudovirales phage TaxID=2100421 RepID=A0A6J5NQQ1_9CAUD|nr:hypothetical protein UFOVP699_134 [uncultured Caudovirales phage]